MSIKFYFKSSVIESLIYHLGVVVRPRVRPRVRAGGSSGTVAGAPSARRPVQCRTGLRRRPVRRAAPPHSCPTSATPATVEPQEVSVPVHAKGGRESRPGLPTAVAQPSSGGGFELRLQRFLGRGLGDLGLARLLLARGGRRLRLDLQLRADRQLLRLRHRLRLP